MMSQLPRSPVVGVVADTDSRWKWGMATAERLNPERVVAFEKAGPLGPSTRQREQSGVDSSTVRSLSLSELPTAIAGADCGVVVIALPGDACQALLHALAAHPWPSGRPVVLTGYVGVVFERVVEGLLLRGGVDVLLADSRHDAELFRGVYRDVGLDPRTVVETRLPFLLPPGPRREAGRFTLTFAAQPDAPSTRGDRAYLVDRLVQHARARPDRDVVLKVRSLRGEHATRPEPYPYPRLLRRRHPDPPGNLRIEAGPMAETLRRTDLLVAVSSTALAEAIHLGIPTGVLTDFGVGELLGNHYYVGSRCLVSFDDLDEGVLPVADREWASFHGLGDPLAVDELGGRVSALLQSRLDPLRPFYTDSRSPAYLPRLLAAHGLTPDGRAQPGGGPGRRRRMVQSLARVLYRQGVNVMAPVLRRLSS